MNHKDEFAKWISAVSEDLSRESLVDEEVTNQDSCGNCGEWDCPECFPDTNDSTIDHQENDVHSFSTSKGLDEEPKPTKTKQQFDIDDTDDVLNPRKSYPVVEPNGEFNDTMPDADKPMPSMPRSSSAATRQKTQNMAPNELMRDFMGRISPDAGAGEPDLHYDPQDQENALVVRTPTDVPAVISSAMAETGTQTPEWHTVNNLPGYSQRNVRGMGRQIFSMFTSTPLEEIQTIANVGGQGPNTDAELRAVASWLHNNAEDLGDVKLDHGVAIPGYRPDVKEYSINGVRFHVVRDPMGQYIYAYPDVDARIHGPSQNTTLDHENTPKLHESPSIMFKPTLFEHIKWDQELEEAFIEESSLSKLIGKQKGGQKLVQWLHRKHKLGNLADLQPQSFNERMLWKEFKRNPDNFVVVSATNGVAGIKPYEEQIRDRMKTARKKGREYDPGGDSTLQYQIIAFTDDGQQVDPTLLQPARQPGEEREVDPTVMKARMGKISGKDIQNPDNVFNLLADQIGALRIVYLATAGVEREKIKGRADMNKEPAFDEPAAIQKIFNRVRPVLKTLANQALSQINNRAKRYIDGGNFEAATKVSQSGAKLKQFLVTIDTSGDIAADSNVYGSNSFNLGRQIKKVLQDAAGQVSGPKYDDLVRRAATGSSVELKPILDALRDNLVALG